MRIDRPGTNRNGGHGFGRQGLGRMQADSGLLHNEDRHWRDLWM
jgi:hypothetical protein